MASGNFVQNDFTGGEWSQVAQGQTSEPRYKRAMNVCLNGYPMEEKPWIRRPGTRHAAPSRRGAPSRTMQLNFTGKAPYTMEFTDGHLRMFSGPSLLKDTSSAIVSNVSTATPAVITLQSAAAWETGAEIEFTFSDMRPYPALAYLANRQFSVQKIDTTHFSLFDSVTLQPVDGSKVTWNASYVLRASEVVDFETAYTDEAWRTLKAVQSDKRITFLNNTVAPQVLTILSLPTDVAPATFELTDFQFKDGPYLDPIDGSIITPDATNGLINMTLSFTAWSSTRAYKRGDFVSSSSIGYRSLTEVNLNNTPASSPTHWEVVSPGQAVGANGFVASDVGRLLRFKDSANNWTWGRISGLSSTGAIDGQLAGSVNIGNYTNIERVFDGVATKAYVDCAGLSFSSGTSPIYGYIGKNYSGNGGRAITSAIIYPSNNFSFTTIQYQATVINLRASMTSPSGPSDGTLLATSGDPVSSSSQGASPIVLSSNDTSTVWNYVWAEILTYTSGDNGNAAVASVQFFGTGAAPAGAGVQVQLLGSALANTGAMSVWRLGAYSDTTGWPSCGCYHEGRLFLGGAIENRWDASKSNDINSFAPTEENGTVADNNAISYTFNSAKINKILWMRSTSEGIVFGNQSGEGQIKATQANLPLSPTNAQAHLVTEYGCADVEPVLTGLTTVFVHRFKRQVYEYLTDAYSGKFFGRSLTRDVKHLVDAGIEEMTYQQERTPIVWGRTGNDALVGMTYRRISQFSTQEAEVLGWHRHVLGSGRSVESICTGPSIDGSIDALAMVTNEENTGVRHVEMMTNAFSETDEAVNARFLDNHSVPVNGTKITKIDGDYIRFSGLWHLNGKKVSVWAAGLDCGDLDVVDGAVDVKLGVAAGGAFTISKLTQLTISGEDFGDLAVLIDGGAFTIPAVVGFSYTSRGQLLRPSDSEDSRWGRTGAQNGPAFGKIRRVHEVDFLLVKTQGLRFGTSFDRLRTLNFRKKNGTGYEKDELFSGVIGDSLDDEYSTEGMICWEVTRPYPATISAVGGYLATQDK